jgi:hypothetical protein
MAVLKYYDGSDWEPVASALQGPTGAVGVTGATGPTGSDASSGLVLISTTSFSAVASQSVNDVFSATYNNYVIFIDATFASAGNINLRYRVSGSDDSTSNYNYQNFESSSTSNASERQTGQNTSVLTYRTGDRFTGRIDFFNPFATSKTTYTNSFSMIQTNSPFLMNASGVFGLTTSFTGFTLIASTSTITGSMSVYGLAK